MKIHRVLITFPFKYLFIACMLGFLVLANNHAAGANQRHTKNSIDTGYSALKLFLEDEQHLTTIRRVKTIISFRGISDNSTKLIDEIADSSKSALVELEKLTAAKPVIVFEEFSDESIGKATLDSLRFATAKEFLLETKDFEKNLLISQSQILRVISHLAKELEEKETNTKRKAWLHELSKRYEKYYQQVFALISITSKGSA